MKRKQVISIIVVTLGVFAFWPGSPLNEFIVRQYWICQVKEATPKNKPFPVVPGESAGSIRIGMIEQELRHAMGRPASRLEMPYFYQERDYGPLLEKTNVVYNYPTQGMTVMLYNGKVGAVSCGHGSLNACELLAQAFTGVTDAGIRISSRKEDILNAYGLSVTNRISSISPGSNRWKSWAEGSSLFYSDGPSILCYPQLGIDFFTKDGKLNHIDIYPRRKNLTN